MGDPSEGGPKKGNDLSKADLDIIQQSNQRGMYYKRKERLRRDVGCVLRGCIRFCRGSNSRLCARTRTRCKD